jgi:hypothetical protein
MAKEENRPKNKITTIGISQSIKNLYTDLKRQLCAKEHKNLDDNQTLYFLLSKAAPFIGIQVPQFEELVQQEHPRKVKE